MATPDEVTGPVNLGNPGEFTIRELAEKVLGADRLAVGDRLPAAAGERPDAAPARHRQGEGAARLAADGARSRRGSERTIAYFDRLLGAAA